MNGNLPFNSRRKSPINNLATRFACSLLLWTCLGGGFTLTTGAAETPPLQLLTVAVVGSDGIFLPEIFSSERPLPAIRLADAPVFGKNLALTRAQICDLLATNAPDVGTNFLGSDVIKITRRSRTFGESELLGLLTSKLQQDYIKDRGQLEITLAQPWKSLGLPDEELTLDVTHLPTAGVTPGFIVRFNLRTAHETLGNWQANLKASVWREIWVASVQLKRGDSLAAASFTRERRDMLVLRDSVADFAAGDDSLEMAESVPAGQAILARMIKARAVLHRGQQADAVIQDGALTIRTKVEVLEDGVPGQMIRARNTVTRRDLVGKVLNEKSILISL